MTRLLWERPTLLALASSSGAVLLTSLVAAFGLPPSTSLRILLLVGSWAALSALLAFCFLPGFGPAMRRAPDGAVALTFDDGPHPDSTPALLRALQNAGVRATFFVVGEAVERWPGLVRQIVAEGHALGNHTQRHRLLTFRTAAQVEDEIAACQRALAGVGVQARLFRPPHGFRPIGLGRVLRRHRLRLVAWQGSIRDTDAPGVAAIVDRAVALAAPGRILLLHDHPRCLDHTVRAVTTIVARYQRLGYRFVPLDGAPEDAVSAERPKLDRE